MDGYEQRAYWVDTMTAIAGPVLEALSQGRLREVMPVEQHGEDRSPYAHLEAFGRTLCGVAPWLDAQGLDAQEEAKRVQYEKMALQCIRNATDPASPDYMNFENNGRQPLVDTAFFVHGLLRAPKRLVGSMDAQLKQQVVTVLRATRKLIPRPSNWLLFSAMVEAGIYLLGEEDYDLLRVKYAIRQFMQWYKGDGIYGDGPALQVDYYNSFVIVPMLVDVAATFAPVDEEIAGLLPVISERATRYAFLLERMISPEGTYPIIGRSITYRFGAFQMLSQAALEDLLGDSLPPAQVRCALTAVIKRIMDAPGLFDENGWLRPGVYGYQPGLSEQYISTGSLYLCCAVFLPLGLAPEHPFWSGDNVKWTAQRIADGEDFHKDHGIVN